MGKSRNNRDYDEFDDEPVDRYEDRREKRKRKDRQRDNFDDEQPVIRHEVDFDMLPRFNKDRR